MRIGLIAPPAASDSVRHVWQATVAVLGRKHEVCPLPREHAAVSPPRRKELIVAWLRGLDALVGKLDREILQARTEIDRRLPWAVFVLGGLPRGAVGLSSGYRQMYTSDILVCNCSADVALCRQFFPNATVRLVPLAYDSSLFEPADDEARLAARRKFDLDPGHKVVLYSGRLTIEKNVHTVLKVFRIVLDAVPAARLLIAGIDVHAPFAEFGCLPTSTERSLRRLSVHLGLGEQRARLIGHQSPRQLKDLYSTADVLLNLTLHHDENFGLAQVEAMACGLPVVGTLWGGLKDTILDGVTGCHVPTVVTAAGVKVDWWSAAQSVVRLLGEDAEARDMRLRCARHARDTYSLAAYGAALDALLTELGGAATRAFETLVCSAFAAEFWRVCGRDPCSPPPYRRGADSNRLYRQLVAPYAAASSVEAVGGTDCGGAPATDPGAVDTWYLPAPLAIETGGTIAVNDPIFPMELRPPAALVDAVQQLVSAFTECPVLSAPAVRLKVPGLHDALAWMRSCGLVLPTRQGTLAPDWARLPVGRPSLRLQRVDHDADVVWFS